MELTVTDVERWLAEDLGDGDVTSLAVIDEDAVCEAQVLLKEPGVVCGLDAAGDVFGVAGARFEPLVPDGQVLVPGPVARVEGPARAVLAAERTALNLLGRLSGIATLTRSYVDAVSGTGVEILDTRKTTPGLRGLEKYAVRCGGGTNHRLGLYDAVLIKDNHIRLAGGIRAAVERARSSDTTLTVEVEAENLEDVREAHEAGADLILLDNMEPRMLREAVSLAGHTKLEASGGVTLENVREIAETGVDFVSIGALTHSARALDVSLEVL
jgi:nicotinate-nucleotide pyrophosphorylase (carboxylating)